MAADQPRADARRALSDADRAAIAGDFDAAVAKYRAILTDDPRNALVHYRIGQAHAAKGDSLEAEQAYFGALRFAGADDRLRAKVLFCLANLRERRRADDAALEAWTEYEKQAVRAASAAPHAATAAERMNRIVEWKRASAAATEIKARAKRRIQELRERAGQRR